MPAKYFTKGMGINKKDFFVVFFLLFNTFTWFYAVLLVATEIMLKDPNTVLFYRAIYYTAAFTSSVVGSISTRKIKRIHFLQIWMILGVATTLLPVFTEYTTDIQATLTFSLLGASFGLGMPSCLAYFADNTLEENRGSIGGVTFFATNLGALTFTLLFLVLNLQLIFVVLAIWRALGLILTLLINSEEKIVAERKHTLFISVIRNRSFIFYFVPWAIFSLIDILEKSILKNFIGLELYRLILIIGPIVGSISALAGGLLCDRIGRKKVVIYGFVSLGLAYAVIGIAPTTMLLPWYFFSVVSGISTGMLWVTFILVLWGDLSPTDAREKYYVIGSAPFLLTEIIPLLLTPFVALIPAYTAFSLAAFFLFLAVLPLMYATETLPEKKMEIRRLKTYIEKAKKLTKKYTNKSDTKS